jgi:hypothetical protein
MTQGVNPGGNIRFWFGYAYKIELFILHTLNVK